MTLQDKYCILFERSEDSRLPKGVNPAEDINNIILIVFVPLRLHDAKAFFLSVITYTEVKHTNA